MKIKDYRGHSIEYDPNTGEFVALKDGETLYQRKTQKEVEDALDKASKQVFQRIEAIDYMGRKVTITSWDSQTGYGWVTGPNRREKFGTYSTYYKQTPENLARIEEVQRLDAEITALNLRRSALLISLSDKVVLGEAK